MQKHQDYIISVEKTSNESRCDCHKCTILRHLGPMGWEFDQNRQKEKIEFRKEK